MKRFLRRETISVSLERASRLLIKSFSREETCDFLKEFNGQFPNTRLFQRTASAQKPEESISGRRIVNRQADPEVR